MVLILELIYGINIGIKAHSARSASALKAFLKGASIEEIQLKQLIGLIKVHFRSFITGKWLKPTPLNLLSLRALNRGTLNYDLHS